MITNIALSLSEVAQAQKDKIGVIEAKTGAKFTFDQLEKRSNDYAWYLKNEGIKPGDRVILMIKPSMDFICLSFALFKLGATVILIDPGMGYKNLLRCIEGVEPRFFIGIPKAYLFATLYKSVFHAVEKKFCCGNSLGIFGPDLKKVAKAAGKTFSPYLPAVDDLAAIIFTTGSTGPPKGVCYEHSIFSAQMRHIRDFYKIDNSDIDQPAFPLFALFSTALGACTVIPDMDATKPAKVNPEKFVYSLIKYKATYSFGSPALWNVISRYCIDRHISLPNLKKVLMAGAPVSGKLIENVSRILPIDAEIHTPYGATESLPIVSIEGREILHETWPKTMSGAGTCVGRSLPGIDIKIIAISDGKIPILKEDMFLGTNRIGEIIVSGDVVTRAYYGNDKETEFSKLRNGDRLWHRLGDTGYLDDAGRLWFCGRKSHRVETAGGVKFTIQCEAIANNHPDIYRSALVGIAGSNGAQIPVLIFETEKAAKKDNKLILQEVKKLLSRNPLTSDIEHFLFHDNFPVDIRHNAKIFREKLQSWAELQLKNNE